MKTAISVPDETFAQVERHAKALGMTRSQFYTTAARRYLDQLEAESLTGQINAIVDLVGVDESNIAASTAGRRLLDRTEEVW
jgi:metal-responsive CopG/Arc/MetJ family transcriptional regulator